MRGRRDQAEPCRLVQHGRGVTEELILLGVVVKGVRTWRRVFDAQRVPVAARGNKIFLIAEAAAIVEAGRDGLAAAAVKADLTARLGERSAGNVKHACGA